MTLEEKFWQLFMIPGDLDDPKNDYSHGVFGLQIRIPDTTVDAARHQAEKINAIQKYFVEQTRLGIPIIPFEEALPRARRAQRDGSFRRRSGSRPPGTRQ
jgi:beta-glucosidase